MNKYIIIIISIITLFTHINIANAGEIRLGVMVHDIKKTLRQKKSSERGENIIAEYIFGEDYKFLCGLPHIGTSINNQGYISNLFYSGITWRFNFVKEKLFIELTCGFSINNGGVKVFKGKRKAVGSNILFRESISLGINLTDNINISGIFDHSSNAFLAKPNRGLDDIGVRLGFRF